jgi:hypothetical protein
MSKEQRPVEVVWSSRSQYLPISEFDGKAYQKAQSGTMGANVKIG